ncbi:MAG: response regulator transcription factor [Candidatus Izemoplasmatales bacterium]|nr:response regulator transcription factor [Candidatus Izemoplasmatales bacterium]
MRLLIAEDQETLLQILKERMMQSGYMVDAVRDGQEALDYVFSTDYDLLILDIMLPKKSGLEVLSRVRAKGMSTPVLLLTAKDQIQDKVKGLDAGADDYVVKPFAFEELLARVRSLLRRHDNTVADILKLGDLTMNRTLKEVTRQGDVIHLSKKEYMILEYMLLNKDIVISREALENVSSNYDYEGYSNVIDAYIRLLRKKIDLPYEEKLIHTVRGFGYVLRRESE